MEISITGQAETAVAPDEAVVTLVVEGSGRDAARVAADVHTRTNRLLEEIDRLPDGTVAAVHTDGVRSWADDHDRRTTHTATGQVRVTFADFTRMAECTAAWAAAGVEVRYTSWRLSDARRRDALAGLVGDALDQARTKAEVIANHLGATGLEVVHVTDDARSSAPAFAGTAMRFAGAAPAAPDPVEARPEDIVVETALTVVFRTR